MAMRNGIGATSTPTVSAHWWSKNGLQPVARDMRSSRCCQMPDAVLYRDDGSFSPVIIGGMHVPHFGLESWP